MPSATVIRAWLMKRGRASWPPISDAVLTMRPAPPTDSTSIESFKMVINLNLNNFFLNLNLIYFSNSLPEDPSTETLTFTGFSCATTAANYSTPDYTQSLQYVRKAFSRNWTTDGQRSWFHWRELSWCEYRVQFFISGWRCGGSRFYIRSGGCRYRYGSQQFSRLRPDE